MTIGMSSVLSISTVRLRVRPPFMKSPKQTPRQVRRDWDPDRT